MEAVVGLQDEEQPKQTQIPFGNDKKKEYRGAQIPSGMTKKADQGAQICFGNDKEKEIPRRADSLWE